MQEAALKVARGILEVKLNEDKSDYHGPAYHCSCGGVAINPLLAEGQVEGALLNGISYALSERYIYDGNGRLLNPSFGTYGVWFTRDLPEIRTFLVPTYEPTGPFGAKSIAEVNINGPMPAISNAIFDAVGLRLRTPPYTPEKVFMALHRR